MRSPARPFSHASAAVPLTGREPVIGRLRGRLEHRGRGWGQIILTGPRGAGISRLLDECVRLLGAEEGRPVFRFRPAWDEAPPLEPVRQALLAWFARGRRDEVRAALEAALGSSAEVGTSLAWILDGPLAGAAAPAGHVVRALLRGMHPGGPLLADDLARLDPASRGLLESEGDADGLGLLAGATAGEIGPSEARWPLEPLGELQIELLLRRWLRHPVATRRLTPLLHRRTGGWPGSVVRAVRQLGRQGALAETSRGVGVVQWPPPFDGGTAADASFPVWVLRQADEVRRLLAVASLQGDPEDDHFLARAASVRLRVVTDTRAELEEVFPAAAGRLFPGEEVRLELARGLDPASRRDLVDSLHRTWTRRREEPEPRAASRAARLRVAIRHREVVATAAALERFVACVPAGAAPGEEGRRLLEKALDLLPAGALATEQARRLLAQPSDSPVPGDDANVDVARRASRHEALADRAGARGRNRARAAHLRRAARLHEAHGAVRPAGEAWRALAETETQIGHAARAFDARLRALSAFEALGDLARAGACRHLAAEAATELAAYDRAVELLHGCLAERGEGDDDAARRATLHLSLARAQHGRGDLDAERRHAEAACAAGATDAVRLGAEARLLALRLRAGEEEVGEQLAGLEASLERCGLPREAGEVRRVLAARRHLDASEAMDGDAAAPAARLRRARRLILRGMPAEGRALLGQLADDARVSVDLRVEALARLAHALLRGGDEAGAHEAACRADALLEVGRRSRANDASLHHLLAVAFRALGEMGRAIRHRRASRTALRREGGGAQDLPVEEPTLTRGT